MILNGIRAQANETAPVVQILQFPGPDQVLFILHRGPTLRCQLCLGTAKQDVSGGG